MKRDLKWTWRLSTYLQQKMVFNLREDWGVIVNVADGDGDEDGGWQRGAAFIGRLHRQRVMRDLWTKLHKPPCLFGTCLPQTWIYEVYLLSVQSGADCNFSAAMVYRELLQKVTAHYGVPQEVIDRTVLISGCYLWRQNKSRFITFRNI